MNLKEKLKRTKNFKKEKIAGKEQKKMKIQSKIVTTKENTTKDERKKNTYPDKRGSHSLQ